MAAEPVRELSYREILAAAEAVQKALQAKAMAHCGEDEGMHCACAVIDADHATMSAKMLVDLYEPGARS